MGYYCALNIFQVESPYFHCSHEIHYQLENSKSRYVLRPHFVLLLGVAYCIKFLKSFSKQDSLEKNMKNIFFKISLFLFSFLENFLHERIHFFTVPSTVFDFKRIQIYFREENCFKNIFVRQKKF